MNDYCILLTTFESEESARPIIESAVNKGLAACVQRFQIESTYTWDGSLCSDAELLALFKTRGDLYDELASYIEKQHSYDVPEIIRIPVLEGSLAYLNWIDLITKHD